MNHAAWSERRMAIVEVSLEVLAMWLRGEAKTVRDTTAPADLEVIGVEEPSYSNLFRRTVLIYCISESFEPVPEGAEVPTISGFEYVAAD